MKGPTSIYSINAAAVLNCNLRVAAVPPTLQLDDLRHSNFQKNGPRPLLPQMTVRMIICFSPICSFYAITGNLPPHPKKKKLPSTSTLSVRCSAPAELQSANRWIILCRCDAWLSFASVLDALRTHSLLFIAPKCLSTWWERFSLRADLRAGGGQSSSDGSLLLSCNPSHCCCHVQTGLRPINEHGSRFTPSSALVHLKPRPFLNPGRLRQFTKWVSVVEFRAVRMSPSLPLPTVGAGLTLPPLKAAKSERMGKTLVKQQRLLPSNRCSRCQLRERLVRQPRHCSGICKTHTCVLICAAHSYMSPSPHSIQHNCWTMHIHVCSKRSGYLFILMFSSLCVFFFSLLSSAFTVIVMVWKVLHSAIWDRSWIGRKLPFHILLP